MKFELLALLVWITSQEYTFGTQSCSTNQYYNTLTFQCTSCPTGMTRLFTGSIFQCVCDPSQAKIRNTSSINFLSSTYCGNLSISCQSNQVISSYDAVGQTISPNCNNCSGTQDPTLTYCIPFGHPRQNSVQGCTGNYTFSIQTCISDTDYAVFNTTLLYQPIIYYLVGCLTYQSSDICSQLINLCVLQLYLENTAACTFFKQKINKTLPSNYSFLPSLYLDQTAFAKNYDQIMSFDGSTANSNINYRIFSYDSSGVLLSQSTLTDELIFCSNTQNDQANSVQFGINLEISCSLDMTPYNTKPQVFYELYLIDSSSQYYQVPIQIGGQLVTRFATIFQSNKTYASYIKIHVTPFQGSIELIQVPFVEIHYDSFIGGTGYFTFKVTNYMTDTSFFTIAMILYIVGNIVIVISSLARIYLWTKANPMISLPTTYTQSIVVAGLRILLQSWSGMTFYFLLLMTAYWFIFFKFQSSPFLLLLDSDDTTNYIPFYGLFYSTFFIKVILMIDLIWRQSSVRIFFIDWEKTEFMKPQEVMEEAEELRQKSQVVKNNVSIWRSLLVANEFNELMISRVININWSLILMGFIFIGLKFDDRSQETPDLINTHAHVKKNDILRFFLVQVLYLVVGMLQIVCRRLLNIWIPYPYEDFVDLCSIANISIFMLDDNLHGYYIHGENPFGFSEGSIQHLENCLRNEAKSKGKSRGLIKDNNTRDGTIQTFEIFAPPKFKDKFFKFYSQFKDTRNQSQLRNLGIRELEMIKFQIQRYLESVIKEVKKQQNQYIRVKENMQRFLDYPPDDILFNLENQIPIFYKDEDYSFKSILFYGSEWDLLIFDTMMFCFWLFTLSSFPIALLLNFIFIKMYEQLKGEMSKNNLSDRTKIDKRFLI